MTAISDRVSSMSGDWGPVTVQMHRNSNAFITRIDDAVEQLLGWRRNS